MGRTLLGIYLNDHLAGATAGMELARRLARTEGGWAGNGRLDRLADEIAADRDELRDIMSTLGEPARSSRVWLGWGLEKLGRLKLNGRIVARSPLSRILELEAMRLGVEGTVAAWRTLRSRAAMDPRLDTTQLDKLIARGRNQIARLERLRVRAVVELFGSKTPTSSAPAGGDEASPTTT